MNRNGYHDNTRYIIGGGATMVGVNEIQKALKFTKKIGYHRLKVYSLVDKKKDQMGALEAVCMEASWPG